MTRDVGDKLIPKLIPVIRDTIIATKKGLAGHDRDVRSAAIQRIIDDAGIEIAELYRPIVDKLLSGDTGSLSPETIKFLSDAKSGEHQLKAAAGLLLGPVAGAIGTLISNELAPIVYAAIGDNPHLKPDPGTLTSMAARTLISQESAQAGVAEQGYDGDWFEAMLTASYLWLDPGSLQELLRRGEIDNGQFTSIMEINGYEPDQIPFVQSLAKQIISPADAALAVLRNNITLEQGNAIAGMNGLTADQLQVLIGNTGEPPGVMDMLSMFRRHIIDQPTLVHGILESRLRDEWIDPILAYRYQPMTTADAIDATVQGHLSEDDARAIADQNGLEATAFDPLLATAGEPLSKTEMLQLMRRGEVTVDQVKQALRESRLKDDYIETALLLSVQIPALYEIKAMLASGSITDADATRLLSEDGYQDFVIKAIVQTAHKTKTVKVREVTEGMLSELYQEQAITADQFRDELVALGYSKAESSQIQQIDDWRIAKTNRDAAITHLRSAYVAHKIDSADVQSQLDALQVPSDMRDKLLSDWDLEIKSAVKLLTGAEIADAWEYGILDEATSLAMLVNLGYSGNDAGILLEIKNKGPIVK